jgi:hypothetical protein
MGFHADTLGESYVNNEGKATFEKFECEFYDSNLNSICNILGDKVHTEAMDLWHEFGMVTDSEHYELTGEVKTMEIDMAAEYEKLEGYLGKILADQSEADCTNCSAMYGELMFNDSIGIRWMEHDGSNRMMKMIEWLAAELFKLSGRHYCIGNNSATDGFVLVFCDPEMDEPFNIDVHNDNFIMIFEAWSKLPSYEEQQAHWNYTLCYALDSFLDRCCDGTEDWKKYLDPNEEVWKQVMDWNLVGYPEN